MDKGEELETTLTIDGLQSTFYEMAECRKISIYEDSRDAEGRFDARILFFDDNSDCFVCWDVYFRTENVLQTKSGSCLNTDKNVQPTLEEACSDIRPNSDVQTLFRTTLITINCKSTFEGTYHFTYEIDYGGGGICDTPRSFIQACQEPGSPYVDNQVFKLNFAKCLDVTSSLNNNIRFQCLGSWRDDNGNIYSAVADLGQDIPRERYKCLLTRTDQQEENNVRRYSMSRYAACSSLISPYEGDIRLALKPAIYGAEVVDSVCNLPRNFTGTWFTTGEFDSDVIINATHVYFKTKLDQYTYKEQLFTCQANRDSRYLMSVVTIGKCEVDYVCLDFMPRHHNIIRWRMGRPFRLTSSERDSPDHLDRKFRQACTWSSFTFNRNDMNWKYNTFVLNPPAPVDCPVGGRYQFKQVGAIEEHFTTRIKGITARPRHMIDCREYVSEFKSCDNNPKKIFVDAEYCATLDHTGRPIGEYDVADRELSCVGYWMEDMRSYLITYDEEDATSPFRCWVFERLDWRDVIMSRGTRAACGREQTAYSHEASVGASLFMELKESEREFDHCPQRFDPGANPYEKELKIYVLSGAAGHGSSSLLAQLALLVSTLCMELLR